MVGTVFLFQPLLLHQELLVLVPDLLDLVEFGIVLNLVARLID